MTAEKGAESGKAAHLIITAEGIPASSSTDVAISLPVFSGIRKGEIPDFHEVEARPGLGVPGAHLQELLDRFRMIRIERHFGVVELSPSRYENIPRDLPGLLWKWPSRSK